MGLYKCSKMVAYYPSALHFESLYGLRATNLSKLCVVYHNAIHSFAIYRRSVVHRLLVDTTCFFMFIVRLCCFDQIPFGMFAACIIQHVLCKWSSRPSDVATESLPVVIQRHCLSCSFWIFRYTLRSVKCACSVSCMYAYGIIAIQHL